tara:strand:- start:281 stop:2812 length:2532 start_codon:yes stop_codon:yes gene_type:complete
MALKLKGSTSGFVAIDCAAEGGNNTLILPSDNGVAGAIWANNVDTAGVATCTSITINKNGDLTVPGTVSVGGTLTYEDVTNVDAVGLVTAAQGVRINGGGLSIIGVTTGLSVSGVSTFTGAVGSTGNITITNVEPTLNLTDSNNNSDFAVRNNDGTFGIRDTTNGVERFTVASDGTVSVAGNVNTGPLITATGTEGVSASLYLIADEGDDNGDGWRFNSNQDDNDLTISNNTTGSYVDKFTLLKTGELTLTSDLTIPDKIIHSGDTNTAIRFPAADTVSVETAGSERLRIHSGGQVGIKTDTVFNGALLSIGNGQGSNMPSGEHIKIAPSANTITFLDSASNTSDTGNIQLWNTVYNNSSAKIELYHPAANTGGIKLHTHDGTSLKERLRISSAGKVGIGTDSPQEELTIMSTTPALMLRDSDQGGSYTQVSNANQDMYFSANGAAAHAKFIFRSGNNGTFVERVRIDAAGRVIIGHTAAVAVAGHTAGFTLDGDEYNFATLQITSNQNSSAGTYLQFSHQRSGSAGGSTILQDGDDFGRIRFTGGDGTNIDSRGAEIIAQVDGTPGENDMPGRLMFLTTADGAQSTTERMRITSNGDVGINCTPETDSKLHIKFGTNLSLRFNSGQDSLPTINSVQDAGAYNGMVLRSDNLRIYTGVSPSRRMTIDSSGLMSVGTTNTGSARLCVLPNVDGSMQRGITIPGRRDVYDVTAINFVHATTFSSAGSVTFSTTAAVAYNTTSDYRLKQDVVTLTDSITKLKQLNPVHFKWKDMPSVESDGFIAHEVQSVVPSAVTGEKDAVNSEGNIEPQQMDYAKVTPLLTAALQEAIAEIETLKTKVAALEGS